MQPKPRPDLAERRQRRAVVGAVVALAEERQVVGAQDREHVARDLVAVEEAAAVADAELAAELADDGGDVVGAPGRVGRRRRDAVASFFGEALGLGPCWNPRFAKGAHLKESLGW